MKERQLYNNMQQSMQDKYHQEEKQMDIQNEEIDPKTKLLHIFRSIFGLTEQTMINMPQNADEVIVAMSTDAHSLKFRKEEYTPDGEWAQLFPRITECRAHSIEFNDTPLFSLSIVTGVSFCNLTDLSLYSNRIESVEAIAGLDAPLLVNLRLDNNRIASLRGMKKCRFPRLQQLDLQNNCFIEPYLILGSNMPRLHVLRLEDWTADVDPHHDDKSWILRMDTTQLNYIRCPNPNRMKQSIIDGMLRNRYRKVNVMRCNRERKQSS